MKIWSVNPVAFEKWDYRNSVEKGIGGSETSAVELAWRLARRGHEVTTFAPIPDDCPREWRGTIWKKLEEVDYTQEGVWLLYRKPELLDNFTDDHPGQILYQINQDWNYNTFTPERLAKLTKMMCLCEWHKKYCLETMPGFPADKILVTSNGIKVDLIHEVEQEKIERNPHRIMHASSPDRGLLPLIQAFSRARELIPTLELHAFYGFDNLDKLPQFKRLADKIKAALKTPGVTFHGRISQQQLYREWRASGMWVYPTNFRETSCINCMEAQALGAIPIASPVAALEENIRWGTHIDGSVRDPLTIARFSAAILQWADPARQEAIREDMMKDARERFDWEVWVRQLEGEFSPKEEEPSRANRGEDLPLYV